MSIYPSKPFHYSRSDLYIKLSMLAETVFKFTKNLNTAGYMSLYSKK